VKHLRTIVLLAGAMLALAATGQQAVPAHHSMPSVDDQLTAMTEQLNLSADQQAKIKPLLLDQHDQMQGLMRDQDMSSDDRRAKARSIHQSTVSKIRDVLNDDQKKKFEAWQQEMHQKMHPHQEGGEPPK